MIFSVEGKFLSVRSRVSTKNQKTYHNIVVLQGDETVSLGCSDLIAESLRECEPMQEVVFEFREFVNSGANGGGAWVSRQCTDFRLLDA